jgi:hypothetical protein
VECDAKGVKDKIMKNLEYLSEHDARSLSLSEFVAAARRTLQELYEKRLYLESNPPASSVLHLSPADRRLLRGFKIKIEESDGGRADSDAPI